MLQLRFNCCTQIVTTRANFFFCELKPSGKMRSHKRKDNGQVNVTMIERERYWDFNGRPRPKNAGHVSAIKPFAHSESDV